MKVLFARKSNRKSVMRIKNTLVFAASLMALVGASSVYADTTDLSALQSTIKIEEPVTQTNATYDQLVTLQFGSFKPASVQITNGSYRFNYGNNISSYMGEAGWALRLFELGGAFYIEENLAFAEFSGSAVENASVQPGGTSYSMDLFGFDTRLMYAADWFPWKPLVPFIDGGYQYSIYFQPGTSGLDSVSGGVGNPVAAGGLRLWLNRAASLNGNHPVFLMAKVNRIFGTSNSVDLESTSFFGGVSFGL
jgi:hypothetical protein